MSSLDGANDVLLSAPNEPKQQSDENIFTNESPVPSLSDISVTGYQGSSHQRVGESMSVPVSNNEPTPPAMLALRGSLDAHQRLFASSQNRPKLRGRGGYLAGVRLYRQRTENLEEQAHTSADGRHSDQARHSVFSIRSSQRDRNSVRYRRIQNKIYNILERPKDSRAISYHVLSFGVVFACLVLSIVQSADDSIILLNEISISVELLMLLWFTSEYVLRIWSAGCRSKYQSFLGRLRFARRPLCIIDAIVIIASVVVVVINASSRISLAASSLIDGNTSPTEAVPSGNMVPALRGLRFFQIMRMMRLDRRGSSWRLLCSVIWAHRQELFTAFYTGFLVLIFASFAMYMAERETNEKEFKSYADALWWGVITLCTVGYGDKTPKTAIGRVIGSCCAMIGISFFALPPGILGSGLALKVQQQQRQKHQIRRRVPAAMLIQALWRMVGTESGTVITSTWRHYINHQRRTKQLLCSGVPSYQIAWGPTTVADRFQIAAGKLVSVSRRSIREKPKFPSESFEPPPGITMRKRPSALRHHQTDNEDQGPTGPLSTAQCNAIRAVRRMKFLACRRKLRESMRPYDVKDVIEQYSTGHAEVLSRMRQLQYRMDDMALALSTTLQAMSLQQQPQQPPQEQPQQSKHGLSRHVTMPSSRNRTTPVVRPDTLAQRAKVKEESDSRVNWRMTMLDQKLDMLIDMLSSSNPNIAGQLKPPPQIVISASSPMVGERTSEQVTFEKEMAEPSENEESDQSALEVEKIVIGNESPV